jgi:hypothetical protein
MAQWPDNSILGNFLEFGGLLTTDAEAGFQRHDVAGCTKIAHAKQLALMKGVEPMDLKGAVGLRDTFQANLAAVKALVLHRVEKVGSVSRKRLILIVYFQEGTGTSGSQKRALNHRQRFFLARP